MWITLLLILLVFMLATMTILYIKALSSTRRLRQLAAGPQSVGRIPAVPDPLTATHKSTVQEARFDNTAASAFLRDTPEDAIEGSTDGFRNTLYQQQGMTFKFKQQDGRFIHTLCSGSLLTRLNVREDQVVGHELKDFLPRELADRKEAYYKLAWEGAENVVYEGALNGITYIASLRPLRTMGKVSEVIATCVDITERKKMEQELMKTKELLESFIQHTADGILMLDKEGTINRANDAFLHMFGYNEQELIGRRLTGLCGHEHLFQEVINKLSVGGNITDLEMAGIRKDGTAINFIYTATPIRDCEGGITAVVGIYRDITERKKTEAYLRKSDKLSAVGQLAAGLAHEIRNPLTSLKGFTQLLRSSDESKNKHYFDIMLSELERINAIVSEFLMVAKPQVTVVQRTSLKAIICHVVILMESQANLKDVRLSLHYEGNGGGESDIDPEIICSEVEIKQVFINVIKNAIEAMPQGGEVVIRLRPIPNDHAAVLISDQGVGIPEDKLPLLGEPFYTTKETGTGLGLMMCYKIIHSHKGEMYIRSKPGEGTTVEMVFPTI